MNRPAASPLGTLVLVPNTLDHGASTPGDLRAELPQRVIERAAGLTQWIVEDAKTARAFLKRVQAVVPLTRSLQEITMQVLPRPGDGAPAWQALLAPALAGTDIGLLSEAGLPAVADPGAALVSAAHRLGVRVEPLAGPNSLMLALAASGLDGQHFAFVGYLPVKDEARTARIRELEAQSRREGQTQIAIETPYRNAALLAALVTQLQPTTRLSVACGIGWPDGWHKTMSVAQWRRAVDATPQAIDNRIPAVFLWLASR